VSSTTWNPRCTAPCASRGVGVAAAACEPAQLRRSLSGDQAYRKD
jgi:hypothetical protein